MKSLAIFFVLVFLQKEPILKLSSLFVKLKKINKLTVASRCKFQLWRAVPGHVFAQLYKKGKKMTELTETIKSQHFSLEAIHCYLYTGSVSIFRCQFMSVKDPMQRRVRRVLTPSWDGFESNSSLHTEGLNATVKLRIPCSIPFTPLFQRLTSALWNCIIKTYLQLSIHILVQIKFSVYVLFWHGLSPNVRFLNIISVFLLWWFYIVIITYIYKHISLFCKYIMNILNDCLLGTWRKQENNSEYEIIILAQQSHISRRKITTKKKILNRCLIFLCSNKSSLSLKNIVKSYCCSIYCILYILHLFVYE